MAEGLMPAGMRLVTADEPDVDVLLESIVNLHASCILNDHTMATFIPPLSQNRMQQRWQSFLDEGSAGKRVILIFISPTADRTKPPCDVRFPFNKTDWPTLSPTEELSGVVSLAMPDSETGPFRGTVQNLFISPYHRRKGIARKLLEELERQALGFDRWNLMLDTMQGSEAETLYEKLNWRKLGVVEDYGRDPRDGHLINEVFFVKDLRK